MEQAKKVCKCCGEEKVASSSFFWQSKYFDDFLHDECRVCATKKFLIKEAQFQTRFREKYGHGPDSEGFSEQVIGRAVTPKQKKRVAQTKAKAEVVKLKEQGLKKCKACGEVKLVEDFHVKVAKTGQLMSECKVCHKEKRDAREKKASGSEAVTLLTLAFSSVPTA
jgi:hypothetical protein